MTDQAAGTERLQQQIAAMRAEVSKAFVGQQAVIDGVLIALLAGGHVLLEGVPGLGKTLLVKSLAKAFAGRFSRIQFTPDLMPSDVSGHAVFDSKADTFKIRKGPVFANLLLADEINRAPAKTQAALLEVMQENQVTIEGTSVPLEPPFMTIATQNPVEHEGTYPLPEAQLDRFLFKVLIDYPTPEAELQIVKTVTAGQVGDKLNVDSIGTVMSIDDVLAAQQLVARTHVDDQVIDYAVRIVRETRQMTGIRMGAGPRGSISIIRAARASAFLENREFVTPDDIEAVARPTLRHRIALAPELEIEAYRPDDILEQVLQNVSAPRK